MNTVKPESIALFCLTPGGVRLAKRLAAMLPLTCYTSEALQEEGFIPFNGGFASAAREAFSSFSALIFIGATGIAVRVLAPLVNDKLSDPAVVVIDERARHVISLLSGHAGGANALTRYLAGMLDADPVITTATDVNELAALDTLAFQLNARMTDFRAAVKTVNQMLVSGKRVGLWCDGEFIGALSRCDRRGFIPVSDPGELAGARRPDLRHPAPVAAAAAGASLEAGAPAGGGGDRLSARHPLRAALYVAGSPACRSAS